MTDFVAQKPLTISAKVLVVFALIFMIINLIDFTFYGQEIRNIVAAVGLGLMAYGIYKRSNFASITGSVLAVGAIAAKYLM